MNCMNSQYMNKKLFQILMTVADRNVAWSRPGQLGGECELGAVYHGLKLYQTWVSWCISVQSARSGLVHRVVGLTMQYGGWSVAKPGEAMTLWE